MGVKRDFTPVKRKYHPLNLDGGRNWNHPGEMSIHPPNSSPPPKSPPLYPIVTLGTTCTGRY